jgi:transposase
MQSYSNDLRERLVAAIDRGEHSIRQIAELFTVSLSFLVRLLQRRRQTGSIQPRPHAGGPPPKLDEHARQRLRELVHAQPDATLAELHQRLGVPCSLMTVARALRRLGLTRKKKTLHAQERDTPQNRARRRDFEQQMAAVDPDQLIFVDEMGATTALTRMYGRAPAGQRVVAAAPGQWENVTLIVGLRPTAVVAPLAFPGATDTGAFQTYVEKVLVPELRPGDVVVWDNLQPHKNTQVLKAVEAAGARVVPLPPYSPDETPIEELFSKAKGQLRTLAARTTEAVITAMGTALAQITPSDIRGWFQDRCAYAMH